MATGSHAGQAERMITSAGNSYDFRVAYCLFHLPVHLT